MKLSLIMKAALVASAAAIGVASTMFLKMKNDNIIEQAAEHVIAITTGKVIDLSPEDYRK